MRQPAGICGWDSVARSIHVLITHTILKNTPKVSAINGSTGPHEILYTFSSGSTVFSLMSKQESKLQEAKNRPCENSNMPVYVCITCYIALLLFDDL